ncbi:hypothetical protein QVD17_20901 [Tagetes erecta]|uniref:TF-B3 domain-containing protein n=1 Tax=Tagetes erecta TaxID=13708 RepID=A0AAD8KSJ3_TARER|nr:hypothetical protein QVD17_20901 [Tagetes erecta]
MDDLSSLIQSPLTTSSSDQHFQSQNDLPQSSKSSCAIVEHTDHGCCFRENAEKLPFKKPTCLWIEEGENTKRNMPEKIGCSLVVNDNATRLKRFITGEMNGLDMKLVIQKTLYESDMNTSQNRLNMPIKQLKTRPHEFLTDDEIQMIDESKEGFKVRVMGPKLQMYEKPLWLKKWHMKHSDNYVLKTNWNNFTADNKVLKKDTVIQVWSFRKDGELCFAIVPVERPEDANLHEDLTSSPKMYFNFL